MCNRKVVVAEFEDQRGERYDVFLASFLWAPSDPNAQIAEEVAGGSAFVGIRDRVSVN